jgi:LPXTG-motif cell wall-anchored protein
VTVAGFTDAVAEAVAQASVTVQAAPTTTTSTTVRVGSAGLARTGSEGGSQALYGAGILLIGFGLVVGTRRRRTA